MKKIITSILLMFVGVSLISAQQYILFENKIGATSQTVTNSQPVLGYINEILVAAPSRTGTGIVSVIISPAVGSNMPKTIIYTNASFTTAVSAMPRVTPTDNTGTALSSLTVREKYFCKGDTVTVTTSETNSITNVTFKVWLKVE